MRIVYVGDNRVRGNFGCRATSTALSQLIEKKHEIVGVISGKYTNTDCGDLFFYQYYPGFVYKCISKIKYWSFLRTGLYYFHRLLKGHKFWFSNFDFISYDFDKSIYNLKKCLPANDYLKELDLDQYDFDALVVNGEGSFIFAELPWRECLVEAMLMHWALKKGKKVYFLNAMLSNDPYSKQNMITIRKVKEIFNKCNVVQVREYVSYEYAKKYFSDANIKLRPDALFTWYKYINDGFSVSDGKYFIGPTGADNLSFSQFNFSQEYLCVSGSSSVGLASRDKKEIVKIYSDLVSKIKNKFNINVFLIQVCEGDEFLKDVSKIVKVPLIPMDTPILAAAKILANARVYISGRYHPAIMASLGGTPCVFMSSNSHKTYSIQKLLQYDDIHEYSVLPDSNEIEKIINEAWDKVILGDKLRCKIINRSAELSREAETISDLIL